MIATSLFRGTPAMLTALVCCVAANLVAQEPEAAKPEAEAVEPIVGEEALPNEPGEWDLRASMMYARRPGSVRAALPKVQLFFGIADRLGGGLDVPLVYDGSSGSNFGIGDIGAGVKWLASRGLLGLVVVVGVEARFPTGKEATGVGEGRYEARPYVALLRGFGRSSVQLSAGWSQEFLRSGEPEPGAAEFAGAVVLPIAGAVYAIGEAEARWGAEREAAYSAGLRWLMGAGLSVAAAMRGCSIAESCRWTMIAQVQVALRSPGGSLP